jgi:hypothetical protein
MVALMLDGTRKSEMSAQAKNSFVKRVIRKTIPLADSRESHSFFRNRKTLDVPAYLCGCVKILGNETV